MDKYYAVFVSTENGIYAARKFPSLEKAESYVQMWKEEMNDDFRPEVEIRLTISEVEDLSSEVV